MKKYTIQFIEGEKVGDGLSIVEDEALKLIRALSHVLEKPSDPIAEIEINIVDADGKLRKTFPFEIEFM